MMTRSKSRVKPTRVSPRLLARFGAGLLPPSRLSHKAPASLSDLEWHAGIESVYGEDQWDADEAMEVQAAEAEARTLPSRSSEHRSSGTVPDVYQPVFYGLARQAGRVEERHGVVGEVRPGAARRGRRGDEPRGQGRPRHLTEDDDDDATRETPSRDP
jgi:hypothetical protein